MINFGDFLEPVNDYTYYRFELGSWMLIGHNKVKTPNSLTVTFIPYVAPIDVFNSVCPQKLANYSPTTALVYKDPYVGYSFWLENFNNRNEIITVFKIFYIPR